MAYTINKTNGSIFATVADGTINSDTNVTIIGKNYAGYGEFLGENFIKMLENSANSSAPTGPLTGQLWYDTGNNLIKVYNGSVWKSLGAMTAQSSEPSNNITGDLWFDTVNLQLNAWDGNNQEFVVIGPAFTAGTGTSGAIVDTVTDDTGEDHVVIKLYTENDIVGIVSKDAAFTPQTPISGFSNINPGLQLASSIGTETPLFVGTATNADKLDDLEGTQFLRSDENDETSGTLSILNDTGLTVGADSDFRISISGDDATIRNDNSDGNLILRVNDGGSGVDVITCNGATGRARVSAPSGSLDITNKDYVDTTIDSVVATETADFLYQDGSRSITGTHLPDSGSTHDLGSGSLTFANIYADNFHGEASSAEFSDLAERYAADQHYKPGTVLKLGGAAEVTEADELSEDVFGVVTTKPGFFMNIAAGDDKTHPGVVLSGRVPVRVIGKVKKGERLVSAGNGLARAGLRSEITPFNVIGRALENKSDDGNGTIEAYVTVN